MQSVSTRAAKPQRPAEARFTEAMLRFHSDQAKRNAHAADMPLEEKDDLSEYSGRLGAAIRERRKAKGWSRERLAAKASELLGAVKKGEAVSLASLRSYENGNRPIPLNLVPYFAAALGCSIHALLPRE